MAFPSSDSSTVSVSGEAVPVPLFVSGVLVIVLAIAGFWVLSRNTGSGEAEVGDVRAQFRGFVEAMADGDGDTACSMMDSDTAEAFSRRASANLGVDPGTCEEMVGLLATARDPASSTSLRGLEVDGVRVVEVGEDPLGFPDRAEVTVDDGTVVLGRRSGCAGSMDCWRVVDGGPVFRAADPTGTGG